MSIISDALRKVSDQRKTSVRMRDDELKSIFVSDTKKIKTKKTQWNILTGVGTIFIVGFAIIAFLYNADLFSSARYSTTPSLKAPANAAPPKRMRKKAVVRNTRTVPVEVTETEILPIFILNGIIEGRGESLAMINNTILKKGDFNQGGQIINVSNDSVTLFYRDKEITLRIK